jgi:hypothetical protein
LLPKHWLGKAKVTASAWGWIFGWMDWRINGWMDRILAARSGWGTRLAGRMVFGASIEIKKLFFFLGRLYLATFTYIWLLRPWVAREVKLMAHFSFWVRFAFFDGAGRLEGMGGELSWCES